MDSRRLRYLDAMGIRVWERRTHDPACEQPTPPGQDQALARTPLPVVTDRHAPEGAGLMPPMIPPPLSLAEEMATPPVVPYDRAPGEDSASPGAGLGQAQTPVEPGPLLEDWTSLEDAVAQCARCEQLVANRTQTVLGTGDRQAKWMIIGEAPGAEEDRQGQPFVGRAGQLLNNMLQAAGLRREQVYIGNILKCRPPNNRDPRPEEAAACRAYLDAQIALIQPKLILVVGRIAAQELLRSDASIGQLRGTVHRYSECDIPVVVTYHPAYLLRSPGEKRKSWDDLRLALWTFRETASR